MGLRCVFSRLQRRCADVDWVAEHGHELPRVVHARRHAGRAAVAAAAGCHSGHAGVAEQGGDGPRGQRAETAPPSGRYV